MSIHAKKPASVPAAPSSEKAAESSARSKTRPAVAVHKSPAIERASKLIEKGDYQAAAEMLRAAGHEPQVRNALGVCLMRLGQAEQAVQLYRSLVLMPGSVMERAEISPLYKRNFATALLMFGFPSGALEVLTTMRDSESVASVRIRSAIQQWEKSLSLLRRLDWKLNRIEPRNCHVPIDFEPGEFDFEVLPLRPDRPTSRGVQLAA